MASILLTTKKLLNIDPDCEDFDEEIIAHINSVFSILYQLGVGPKTGFAITGDTETWEDFIEDKRMINEVKSYMYAKVRLMFDPPQQSALIEALKNVINEFEWRLNVSCDPDNTFEEE